MTDVARTESPDSYTVVSEVRENPRTCLNCDTPLAGPYCSHCGQRDLPPEPHIREIVAEAWDAFVSVDGKVAQTLRLLLMRPGQLTAEYLTGRRARFLPPLRVYLVCSVLFFLVQAAAPNRASPKAEAERKARVDSVMNVKKRADDTTFARQLDSVRTTPHSWLWKRFKINGLRVARDGKNFTTDFQTQIPRAMFLVMPVYALLLALLYRSRRRVYAVHLVVSLHLHAFFFGMLTVGLLAMWVPWHPVRRAVGWAEVAWVLAYFPLALRRVYGGRLSFAVWRSLTLGLMYSVVAVAAMSVIALALVFFY